MCAGSWVNKSETHRLCKANIYFPNRSSAVISIGAATLADIFDPAVRGKKVSIDPCIFPLRRLTLYRSWEFSTLPHCLDRYYFPYIGRNF